MAELAILIGLPGAGKTSFFRERLAATHVQGFDAVFSVCAENGRFDVVPVP